MVKVIFQLNEMFYWIDHAAMFEPSSQTQNVGLKPEDLLQIFEALLFYLTGKKKLVMRINQCTQERC